MDTIHNVSDHQIMAKYEKIFETVNTVSKFSIYDVWVGANKHGYQKYIY